KPGKLPKSAAPKLAWTTWVWGLGETLAVIGAMIGGFRLSGRAARRRRS
ncbi:MAG: hypothetical protein JWO63_2516, partial [Frankiales bacterium]|nr:hypothetical protein [Frankiales bacterium]